MWQRYMLSSKGREEKRDRRTDRQRRESERESEREVTEGLKLIKVSMTEGLKIIKVSIIKELYTMSNALLKDNQPFSWTPSSFRCVSVRSTGPPKTKVQTKYISVSVLRKILITSRPPATTSAAEACKVLYL